MRSIENLQPNLGLGAVAAAAELLALALKTEKSDDGVLNTFAFGSY